MSVGAGDAITATGAGGSINCGGTTDDDRPRSSSSAPTPATRRSSSTRVSAGASSPVLRPDALIVPGINEIEWYVNLGEDIVDQADPAADTTLRPTATTTTTRS